jgi:hypothetical protein
MKRILNSSKDGEEKNAFNVGMIIVYIPISNRMKLPEIPGNISADIAIAPAANSIMGCVEPSAGEIVEIPKAMRKPTISRTILVRFQEPTFLPI